MRYADTDEETFCECHGDEQNPLKLNSSLVSVLSHEVFVDGKRKRGAVVGYGRKVIPEAEQRRHLHGPYVDHVCKTHERFPQERKVLRHDYLECGQVINCMPGFAGTKNLCNMNPCGHWNEIIEYSLRLFFKFKLSLPEFLSLEMAQLTQPHCAFLYVAAAHALLQQTGSLLSLGSVHRRGYNFGYLLVRVMCEIDQKIRRTGCPLPPRCYNCYRPIPFPTIAEWNKCGDGHLCLCLSAPTKEQLGSTKQVRQQQYNNINKAKANLHPGVGNLGINHEMGYGSMLGTHGHWCGSEIEVTKSNSLMWLIEKFVPKQQRKTVKVADMIDNTQAALETRFCRDFGKRESENIICKVFRVEGSDGGFFDIYIVGSNIYLLGKQGVTVLPPGVNEGEDGAIELKGPLLNQFPFHGVYVTIDDIRRELGSFEHPLTISGLSRQFKSGLFSTEQVTETKLRFSLETTVGRNSWFDDVFANAETHVRRL